MVHWVGYIQWPGTGSKQVYFYNSTDDGFVMKINDQGMVLWMDTLGLQSGDFSVQDLTQTPFGIQFAGYHTVTSTNHDQFTGMIALDVFGGVVKVQDDNIAHFAHIGGAAVGFLLVLIWNKTNKQSFY
jgi:hypothetical protein